MGNEITISILFFLILIVGYYLITESYNKVDNKSSVLKIGITDKVICYFVFGMAILIRIIFSMKYEGHRNDMNCFIFWGDRLVNEGFGNFYSPDQFSDYPPGYMYFLYAISYIRKLLGVEYGDARTLFFTKLPSMMADILIGYSVFKVASKKWDFNMSIFLGLLFLFNPVVIYNSTIWGQVDAFFLLFVIWSIYLVSEKKVEWSYIPFLLGLLIKPQILLIAPIIFAGIINQVFLVKFNKKYFFKNLWIGLSSIACMLALMLPFGLEKVINQYLNTIASYPYATVNAHNVWAMFGLNWKPQTDLFLNMTYQTWGTIAIFLFIATTIAYCIKNRNKQGVYFTGAAYLIIGIFLFSVRMHERYMFPAIGLLLFAFILKKDKGTLMFYGLFSIVHYLNISFVLNDYDNTEKFVSDNPTVKTIAFLSIIIFFLFLKYLITNKSFLNENCWNKKRSKIKKEQNNRLRQEWNNELNSNPKFTKFDWILMVAITLIYGVIAFYDLGDQKAPTSGMMITQEQKEITLDFGTEIHIDKVKCYLGKIHDGQFKVEIAGNNLIYETVLEEMKIDSVYRWHDGEIKKTGRYLKFTAINLPIELLELGILDSSGKNIIPVNRNDYANLFDEASLIPERINFRNGTMFDEIYHARTANEFIQGDHTYEWTHPPFGKILISVGVRIFGMNPFGWRFMGTLFGILMLPIFYAFGKRLFKETWITALITILFASDFMHFSQTRIATIDVFVTFFIILMYFFMYEYASMDKKTCKLWKTFIPLGLCGISMGFGIASKWTGVYAGLGLAIIFFYILWKRYQEAAKNKSNNKNFISDMKKTILFCCVFFIVIPFIIYLLSYIPFVSNEAGLLNRMLKNQESMLSYHRNVFADHPYESMWYQWPIIYRPILFAYSTVKPGIGEAISSFGNPIIWWMSIPAFIYLIRISFVYKNRKSLFLVVGFLAQYLPWVLVPRTTFIYHFFPSVPFIVLMIGYAMFDLVKRFPILKQAAYVYVAFGVILFIAFYPLIAGQPINVEWAKKWLVWLESWTLI